MFQYKDAFFTAHPNFKWYKLPAPPLRQFATRPGNIGPATELDLPPDEGELSEVQVEQTNNNHLTKVNYNAHPATATSKEALEGKRQMFTPGKLADEAHMGGLSSLIISDIKPSEDDYGTNRNYFPTSPTLGNRTPLLETPKHSTATSCSTPNPPKKRPFSESENNLERNNLYRSDEVSPPCGNVLSSKDSKLQGLQDVLSETTRLWEPLFGTSNKTEKLHHKLVANNNGAKHANQHFSAIVSGFIPVKKLSSTPQKAYDEFPTRKQGASESSDESLDKDCQQFDDSNAFEKSKISWNTYLEQSQSKSSGRACKGKRYQQFMQFGGLIVNKRQKKEHMSQERKPGQADGLSKLSYEVNSPTCSWKIYDSYPKKSPTRTAEGNDESDLAYCERTDLTESAYKLKSESDETSQIPYHYVDNMADHAEIADQGNKMFTADDFDLDAKIMALPSLSLERFQQKKKENKKRKKTISPIKYKEVRPRLPSHGQHYPLDSVSGASLIRPSGSTTNQPRLGDDLHQNISYDERLHLAEERRTAIIGSKKRKPRKISITRLDVNSSTCSSMMETAKNNNCTNVYTPDNIPTSTNHLLPTIAGQNTLYVLPEQGGSHRLHERNVHQQLPEQTLLHQMPVQNNEDVDLCALATLAEVAANTSKIKEGT